MVPSILRTDLWFLSAAVIETFVAICDIIGERGRLLLNAGPFNFSVCLGRKVLSCTLYFYFIATNIEVSLALAVGPFSCIRPGFNA